LGTESSETGRSNRRGSALPGVVGDTIEATDMLLVAGETRGCGIRFAAIGDGVWSAGEVRYVPGLVLPIALNPAQDAAELCLLDASVLEKYAESRLSSGFNTPANPDGSFCEGGRGADSISARVVCCGLVERMDNKRRGRFIRSDTARTTSCVAEVALEGFVVAGSKEPVKKNRGGCDETARSDRPRKPVYPVSSPMADTASIREGFP
jgi:hypothetical protein